MSAKYNLVCDQATTFNFQFVINNNSTPWDLTNYSATMTVRPFVGASTTTLVASTANGRITLGGISGRVTVLVDAATTGAIAASRYAYDLVLDSGSEVTRILEGKFIVTGAVTQ
ncbi:MAG: hypothetical protein EB149_08050 [Thaumarchaeota archaeon]|nr:hypothetical protein [Nitrososphaerota archaeon]